MSRLFRWEQFAEQHLRKLDPPVAAGRRLVEVGRARAGTCLLAAASLTFMQTFAHGPRGRKLFSKPNRPTLSAALEQWLAASRKDSPQIT